MARLLGRLVPGLVALLAMALVSSCAAPTQATERDTSRIAASPIPGSTVDLLTAFPIPPSTVAPSAPELATIPGEADVTGAPISPLPTGTPGSPGPGLVPVYTYRIVNTYPHDRGAFTQGLVFEEGVLYEGTGLRGRSTLRIVELETGDVLKLHSLPVQLFGEGVTVYGDRIFQLTWKAQVGFVYDRDFELLQEFHYPTEGWGITHDGQRLIMSDGTSTLHFLDPETLEEIGRIEIYDQNGPVTSLNELEYIDGTVYANVWKTDRIALIDPHTGQVTGWIDLTGLLSEEDRLLPVDVLNGIAYDAGDDRLFVTGKLWPKIFEIELVPEVTNGK
jgi:glutamine cyclotransferase